MSLFNEKLKNIHLKEVLSLIILLFVIHYVLNELNIFKFDLFWVYHNMARMPQLLQSWG